VLPLTKRQREILDYLNEFIQNHGYAPSLEEIGRRFNLSSLATVHKHLSNLQEKGFIRLGRGTLANVDQIGKVAVMPGGTHVAVLGNGQKLPVSRIQSRVLRERLLKL